MIVVEIGLVFGCGPYVWALRFGYELIHLCLFMGHMFGLSDLGMYIGYLVGFN